jgi:hypothetical protein
MVLETNNERISDRERHNVSKSAYDYVDTQTEQFGKQTTDFFKHVLLSGVLSSMNDSWIAVPESWMEEHVPQANPDALINADLLQRKDVRGQSTNATWWKAAKSIRLTFSDRINATTKPKYELFSGEKTDWSYRSNKHDSNKNAHPESIQETMETISHCYFRSDYLTEYFLSLNADIYQLEERVNSHWLNSEDYRADQQQLQNLQNRRTRDRLCLNTIINQEPEHDTAQVYAYTPGYQPDRAGQLHEIGGGLQQCSDEMRRAAAIDQTYEYRIESSLPSVLHTLTSEAGLRTPHLNAYLGFSGRPKTFIETTGVALADAIGIAPDTLKSALDSLCVRPLVPLSDSIHSTDEAMTEVGAVLRSGLQKKYGTYDPDKIYDEVKRFVDFAQGIIEDVTRWKAYLEDTWIPENKYIGHGGYWVKNDVGCSIQSTCVDQVHSFLLRGRRTRLLQALVQHASNNVPHVIGISRNQITTCGEVDAQTIEAAKKSVSMEGVQIVQDRPQHL